MVRNWSAGQGRPDWSAGQVDRIRRVASTPSAPVEWQLHEQTAPVTLPDGNVVDATGGGSDA